LTGLKRQERLRSEINGLAFVQDRTEERAGLILKSRSGSPGKQRAVIDKRLLKAHEDRKCRNRRGDRPLVILLVTSESL